VEKRFERFRLFVNAENLNIRRPTTIRAWPPGILTVAGLSAHGRPSMAESSTVASACSSDASTPYGATSVVLLVPGGWRRSGRFSRWRHGTRLSLRHHLLHHGVLHRHHPALHRLSLSHQLGDNCSHLVDFGLAQAAFIFATSLIGRFCAVFMSAINFLTLGHHSHLTPAGI
jgi:hypothetical protein